MKIDAHAYNPRRRARKQEIIVVARAHRRSVTFVTDENQTIDLTLSRQEMRKLAEDMLQVANDWDAHVEFLHKAGVRKLVEE